MAHIESWRVLGPVQTARQTQPSLDFDSPVAPVPHFDPPPYQKHSDTSREAAHAIEPRADTLRAKVLEFLRLRGPLGATDEELQVALGLGGSTERPRRRELEQADLIRDSGQTRPTSTGRKAVVWVAL